MRPRSPDGSRSELAFEASAVVNRGSVEYGRWLQAGLNQVLRIRLVVDGVLGPRTRDALRRFQASRGLAADGRPGPRTEAALVAAGVTPPPKGQGQPAPRPSVTPRCAAPAELAPPERTALSVTTTFETGVAFGCAVSRVDGISMGMIQWNLKAGTLQAMLRQFEQQGGRLDSFFGSEAAAVRALVALPAADGVARATDQQLASRWREALLRLCGDPLFCSLQAQDVKRRMTAAQGAVRDLGLQTVRGLTMMFDIHVGDGYGANRRKIALFRERIGRLEAERGRPLAEQERLVEIAEAAAAQVSPRWRDERRARRRLIALGRGEYRRSHWELDRDFPALAERLDAVPPAPGPPPAPTPAVAEPTSFLVRGLAIAPGPGLRVTNFRDPRVHRFPGRIRQGRPVDELIVHETVTRSVADTVTVLRQRNLGVHLILGPDGTLTQHGDLGDAVLGHAGVHNGRSVGVEVVNPYYPRYLQAGLPWGRTINAGWAHERRYVLPTPAQAEAVAQLIVWTTSPAARGLSIPRRWVGLSGGQLAMSKVPGGERPGPGIYAHTYFGHADGSWLVLYAWLRLEAGRSPEAAYEEAARLGTTSERAVLLPATAVARELGTETGEIVSPWRRRRLAAAARAAARA